MLTLTNSPPPERLALTILTEGLHPLTVSRAFCLSSTPLCEVIATGAIRVSPHWLADARAALRELVSSEKGPLGILDSKLVSGASGTLANVAVNTRYGGKSKTEQSNTDDFRARPLNKLLRVLGVAALSITT